MTAPVRGPRTVRTTPEERVLAEIGRHSRALREATSRVEALTAKRLDAYCRARQMDIPWAPIAAAAGVSGTGAIKAVERAADSGHAPAQEAMAKERERRAAARAAR